MILGCHSERGKICSIKNVVWRINVKEVGIQVSKKSQEAHQLELGYQKVDSMCQESQMLKESQEENREALLGDGIIY